MKKRHGIVVLALAAVLLMSWVPLWAQEQDININEASVEVLTQLKGVGPVYAERIVQYRQENGPFEKPEDIMEVKGIGPKTWEQNKDQITVE